jgi:hypothetical protein
MQLNMIYTKSLGIWETTREFPLQFTSPEKQVKNRQDACSINIKIMGDVYFT